MASIPVTTYSASKIHEHVKQQQQQHKHEENPKVESNDNPFINSAFGLDPVISNYNSKLMNSIWGMYNLYASHAFQKNSEGALVGIKFAIPQSKNVNLWDIIRSPN